MTKKTEHLVEQYRTLRAVLDESPLRGLEEAQSWAEDSCRRERATEYAYAQGLVVVASCRYNGAQTALDTLQKVEQSCPTNIDPGAKATLELARALVCLVAANGRLAIQSSRRALAHATLVGNRWLTQQTLVVAGVAESAMSPGLADKILNIALTMQDGTNDLPLRAAALKSLAHVKFQLGQHTSGTKYALQAEQLSQECTNHRYFRLARTARAMNVAAQGKLDQAEHLLEDALCIASESVTVTERVSNAMNRAEMYAAAGAYSRAYALAQEVLWQAMSAEYWGLAKFAITVLDANHEGSKSDAMRVDPQLRKLVLSKLRPAKGRKVTH